MKHLLTTLLLSCTSIWAFGQLPVTDVALNGLMVNQSALRAEANVTMGKQLIEAAQQTEKLSNTYKLMKEANEKLKTVSGFIQKYSSIASILKSQKYQYTRIKGALGKMSNSEYITASNLKTLEKCSTRFLYNTNELITIANNVVTPGGSEMNDAERITILMQIAEKMDREAAATNYVIKNLEETEKQRAAMAKANTSIRKVFTGN